MFKVMLPVLASAAPTLTVPAKTVRAPKAFAPLSSTVPPACVSVPTCRPPVKVLAPERVSVPLPTLVRPRAKPDISPMLPVKVLVALPVPTVRVPAYELVVMLPAPERPPMISAPADMASSLPALMTTVALSGIPFKVPPVPAPTWTRPVPARVMVPVKVFAKPKPRTVRPVPMKVTLPVPVMPL